MNLVGHIRIEDVVKTYGEIKALDSVTLDMEMGRVSTLLGVNGSGKTTLLRIMSGLDEPTGGNVLFNNQKMQSQQLRQISTLIFQKTVMFNRSVFDNVALGLRIRGFSRGEVERRVSEALASVGLAKFGKRRARKLSGGEQQRVALARAFAVEPQILLLDEPTANLDPANAATIENVIRKTRERETCTVVLATHNLHQAKRLSDMVVHIHCGKVLEVASPEDFFTHPSNETTRKFVEGELQF